MRKLVSLSGMGLLALAFGVAGCQSSSTRTTGQKMSDREVRSEVGKALEKDPTFKYPDVKANVYDGNVQLTGFVDTPEQRLRAAQLAARTKGAKQVINNIMIKPTPTGPVTIRDPLGHDTGRLLVDTNAPVPRMYNLPDNKTQPAPGQNPNEQESNPKQ